MPWYFYNGSVPVPVQRIDGEIVSVRPRSYIETKPEHVRKFGPKMSRTAPPRDAAQEEREPPLPSPGADEITPSVFAEKISEIGVTKDPSVPATPAESAQEDDKATSVAPKQGRRLKTKTSSPGGDE